MFTLIIVFLASLVATFLSVISGGGTSTISLPIFLWLGMSLPLAIATNKVNAIFFTPISARNYLKGRKIDWKFLILFATIGLFGVYLGVKVIINIDQILLKQIIGLVIIAFVIFTYFKKELGLKEKPEQNKFKKIINYPIALLMGFYEGIIGSGNGIAFAVLTFYTRGFDFISALGHYFAISTFWVTLAAVLYIQQGYFDFSIMASSILGAIIGSYLGSKYARYKGNKFIKIAFVVIGGILGMKLALNI